ncbi:MAG: HEPN domain-containing protein [Geodermatophilaceae bacterium]
MRGDDRFEESDIDILVLLDRRDEPTAGGHRPDAAHAIGPWLSLVIVDFERYHGPASRATGFYEELRREIRPAVTSGQGQRARAEMKVAANDAFRAAVALVELALYRDAVSRLYYAVFHAARAALICHGLQAKTHSGQLDRFAVTFGPAPVVARLLELRIDADYRSDELPCKRGNGA